MTQEHSPGEGTPEHDAAGTGMGTTVPHSARIWNYWLGGTEPVEIYSYCEVGRKP